MGSDKAALPYAGRPQLARAFDLVSLFVAKTFVSIRPDQCTEALRAAYAQIVDSHPDAGPAAGLLAAHAFAPNAGWLVVACDMPLLDATTLAALVSARRETRAAVACHRPGGPPEPFCAIWEPASLARLSDLFAGGERAPRRALEGHADVAFLPVDGDALLNVNTQQDRAAALAQAGACPG